MLTLFPGVQIATGERARADCRARFGRSGLRCVGIAEREWKGLSIEEYPNFYVLDIALSNLSILLVFIVDLLVMFLFFWL